MNILGLLQNQWFNDPIRAQKIYDSHADNLDRIAELNGAYLFMGSKTGKRLEAAFGDEWCDKIIWWEASPKKAGKSSGAVPPDAEWVASGLRYFNPEVVITFGKVARLGLELAQQLVLKPEEDEFDTLWAPHPAARHLECEWELAAVKEELMRVLTKRKYTE